MQLMLLPPRPVLYTWFLCAAAGCPSSPPHDTETAGSSSISSSSSSATNTVPTSAGASTTSESTSEGTTGENGLSSGSGSTGEHPGAQLPSDFCQDVCDYLIACASPLARNVVSCVNECINAAFSDKPGCFEAAGGWWSCLAETTCEGVQIVPSGGCDSSFANFFSMCGGCSTVVTLKNADTCSAVLNCPNVIPFSYTCTGISCTCQLQGHDSFVECPSAGVCASSDAEVIQQAEDCCIVNF